MPSGPALNFNGSYPDRVKLFHTMEPAYSMFWKRHPSPAQQAAVQNLNQQGLYPTKNNRADFTGTFPAPIRLERTNAPGCESMYNTSVSSGCGSYGQATCPCNGCCPGQNKTPMAEIVQRNVCSSCPMQTSNGLQAPGGADYARYGGMKSINRHQVIAVESEMKRSAAAYVQPPTAPRYGGRPHCSRCGGY